MYTHHKKHEGRHLQWTSATKMSFELLANKVREAQFLFFMIKNVFQVDCDTSSVTTSVVLSQEGRPIVFNMLGYFDTRS
jgi:hypothetical protein